MNAAARRRLADHVARRAAAVPGVRAATLFRAYLKLNQICPACGADFSRSETADVAPYVTVMLIALFVAPTTAVLRCTAPRAASVALIGSLGLATA